MRKNKGMIVDDKRKRGTIRRKEGRKQGLIQSN